jgi:plastocyanin
VDALDAGTYYFQCDVHPTMNGTFNVGGGGAGATGATGASGATGLSGATGASGATGSTGGGGGELTVTAQNLVFDTDAIQLAANTPTTITFVNNDSPDILHNISIYTDSSASEALFSGELISGGDSIEYSIPALEAGEYYFRCDVHPNMNGIVTVS